MRASFSLWKWRTGGSGVAEELSAVFRLTALGWALQTRLVLSESCLYGAQDISPLVIMVLMTFLKYFTTVHFCLFSQREHTRVTFSGDLVL